jgi:hypothetical protein
LLEEDDHVDDIGNESNKGQYWKDNTGFDLEAI